jgi:hypothetical protein
MCVALPSSLPEGMIVLEGFVGSLFRYEPSLAQEVRRESNNQQMVMLSDGTAWD